MFFLLYLAAISAALMTGITWLAQLVIYPSFKKIESSNRGFFRQYLNRGGVMYLLYMAFELTMAIIVLFYAYQAKAYLWISLGLLAFIWAVSMGYMAPLMRRFCTSHSAKEVDRMVWVNWLRTLAWTARVVLLTLCVYANM
ncbi:MAG: hypothetical protein S4CHLAM102_15650 [Chlamydiia bacterium]|nr:hypothetical protein [Chlamydiia bacterium]